MSQDIVADVLNQMMNAKKAGKQSVETKRYSNFLLSVLAIAKLKGYIHDYSVHNRVLKIVLGNFHGCSAIKPRFIVTLDRIEMFVSRYLPAKNIGVMIISTSKGLMTHQTAIENHIGGSLIAYIF